MTAHTRRRTAGLASLVLAIALLGAAAAPAAATNEGTCPPVHIQPGGSAQGAWGTATSDGNGVTVTLNEGWELKLCLKAGSANQGDGPEEVDAQEGTHTYVHSSRKELSHWSILYFHHPLETTTTTAPGSTTTTSAPETTTTTAPGGTTSTTAPETTSTTGAPETTTTTAAVFVPPVVVDPPPVVVTIPPTAPSTTPAELPRTGIGTGGAAVAGAAALAAGLGLLAITRKEDEVA